MIIVIGLSPGQAASAPAGSSSRMAQSFFIAPPGSALPDAVALLSKSNGQLDFHVARAIVRHRVVDLVERRQQAQAVEQDEAVRLDAGLVLVEAHVRVEARHA